MPARGTYARTVPIGVRHCQAISTSIRVRDILGHLVDYTDTCLAHARRSTRQRQTAATTSPAGVYDRPTSTLWPAQMTSIDLPATRSHRGDQPIPHSLGDDPTGCCRLVFVSRACAGRRPTVAVRVAGLLGMSARSAPLVAGWTFALGAECPLGMGKRGTGGKRAVRVSPRPGLSAQRLLSLAWDVDFMARRARRRSARRAGAVGGG